MKQSVVVKRLVAIEDLGIVEVLFTDKTGTLTEGRIVLEQALDATGGPLQFCAPTSKNELPILEPEEHLAMYGALWPLEPDLSVSSEDQFGPRTLRAIAARVLLVPTEKNELGFAGRLNHYWCYEVWGPKVGATVTLDDQFGGDTVRVERPKLFCSPVEKVSEAGRFRIEEREVHLTCYEIYGPQMTDAQTFGVVNQFETDVYTVTAYELLCVPSAKLGYTRLG